MADDTELNEGEVSDAMSEYDEHDAHVKDDDDKMTDHQNTSPDTGQEGTGEVKKKLDPKDPLRPRRKKARRACYACQRAHLTCGDERPCQRCIKRGLAEQCQDGVRKKAKYLHDAPPEALGPVLGPSYSAHSHTSRPNPHRQPSSVASEASSNATATAFFSQPGAASTYGVFSPTQQTQVSSLTDGISFSSQQSPVSPTFQESSAAQMGSLTVPQVSGDITSFSPALFDPSNPALYNFNLEGLNFGSQYGAMEFSMLGHMSSGAAETPPRDPSISQPGAGDITFGPAIFGSNNNGVGFDKIYDANVMGDFLGLEQSSGGPYSQGNLQHGLPHAYAIAAGPGSLQSPSTENNSPQPTTVGFDGSPTAAAYANTGGNSVPHAVGPTQPPRPKPKASSAAVAAWFGPQTAMGKRYRDSSRIYENVTEPYMYVRGFHKLIALLQRRLSASKILRVAKSLASIRPSFIACTRTLSRADLIFMEKSFQRSLFEFGEFLEQTSSPTVLCRRTGEVVAVNKEFTALTGWRKEVLLGKEPNLNVNTGNPNNPDPAAGGNNSSGRTGLSTPRLRTLNAHQSAAAAGTDSAKTAAAAVQGQPADSGPQPLFIAELMDDDSVIQFYEDFAQLAFENSRGRVTRKTRLFKYRTQAPSVDVTTKPEPQQQQQQQQPQPSPSKEPRQSILSNRVARIDGEHGISKIAKDGKLECSYCWHIRRDTFDIPMMIVMNFLPCYYPNQEPHQLAV
ncbi:hypothetical protein RB597_004081 [Gaeumannomyces tritici]